MFVCVCRGGWVGFKLLQGSAYTSPSVSISQTCWTPLRGVDSACMGGGEGKASNSLREAPTPACWSQALNIVDMLYSTHLEGIQHVCVCVCGGGG